MSQPPWRRNRPKPEEHPGNGQGFGLISARKPSNGVNNDRHPPSRAILATDVAGYSRLIGADEDGTLQGLKVIRAALIDPKIAAHNGWLVKTTGDGLLVEFGSVVDALRCATELQAPAHRDCPFRPFRRSLHQRIPVVHHVQSRSGYRVDHQHLASLLLAAGYSAYAQRRQTIAAHGSLAELWVLSLLRRSAPGSAGYFGLGPTRSGGARDGRKGIPSHATANLTRRHRLAGGGRRIRTLGPSRRGSAGKVEYLDGVGPSSRGD